MADLIDREAVLPILAGLAMTEGEYNENYDKLMQIPATPKEVRHGRMIEGRYPNENRCSECGQEFRDDIGFIIQDHDGVFRYPKRCPECGCFWDGVDGNG